MEQIVIGTLMIASTVAIHAFASARWLGVVGRWHATCESSNHMEHLLWSMLSTGMVLIVLHIVEATLWALLYWKLPSSVPWRRWPELRSSASRQQSSSPSFNEVGRSATPRSHEPGNNESPAKKRRMDGRLLTLARTS